LFPLDASDFAAYAGLLAQSNSWLLNFILNSSFIGFLVQHAMILSRWRISDMDFRAISVLVNSNRDAQKIKRKKKEEKALKPHRETLHVLCPFPFLA
jgi:hypothetical protein